MKLRHLLLALMLSLTTCGAVANAQDPHFLEAAKGNVPGLTGIDLIGSNEALGATEETVWMGGGKYVYPTTGLQLSIVSTSASDTLGGAGAEIVRITYLRADFSEHTEDVTLAGLTPVLTVATDIYRINGFEVLQSGNGSNRTFNVGDIVASNAGTTYAFIEIGEGDSLSTVYTVPKDKIGYIYQLCGSSDSGKSVTFSLVLFEPGSAPHIHGHIEVYQSNACRQYDIMRRAGAGTDLEMRGTSSAAGSHVEATITMFIVDR